MTNTLDMGSTGDEQTINNVQLVETVYIQFLDEVFHGAFAPPPASEKIYF